MILPGHVVHVCWYGIKAFRVCICVCARSYVLWEESEESDAPYQQIRLVDHVSDPKASSQIFEI